MPQMLLRSILIFPREWPRFIIDKISKVSHNTQSRTSIPQEERMKNNKKRKREVKESNKEPPDHTQLPLTEGER